MLRILPFCLLLTSCGLLKMPARIVHQAGTATVDATKRAASATQKFGKNISDKYFKKDKKEEVAKTENPAAAQTNKNFADLPEPDPYTPAPVSPTVFIPNKPATPPAPSAPAPETPSPKKPSNPSVPGNLDLPDLPPVDLPEGN